MSFWIRFAIAFLCLFFTYNWAIVFVQWKLISFTEWDASLRFVYLLGLCFLVLLSILISYATKRDRV